MSPLYTVFRPIRVDAPYLEHFFETVYWHRYMKLNGDSGARADRFAIADAIFFAMPVPVPEIPEQTAIGNFFRALDERIAATSSKTKKLRTLKQAYLQQMFV
jgi:type I restriction enzyme S subunit